MSVFVFSPEVMKWVFFLVNIIDDDHNSFLQRTFVLEQGKRENRFISD